MSPNTKRFFFWLPGPLLAFFIMWFAIANNVLAGLFFLCVLSAIAFLVCAPLLQLILLSTRWFQGKYGAASVISLASITAVLFVLVTLGLFSFA